MIKDPNLEPAIRERFLQKIHKSAEKLTTMVERFTLAIKLESGEFQPKKSRFDLFALAGESASLLMDRYKGRQIRVEGMSVKVYADRALMELVLTNLMDNALKYSEDDIQVTVENRLVTVTDFGVGIEAEELDKVQQKFYRVGKMGWNNSMGLGLTIVNYILTLHESHLEIQSEPGEGSRFSFYLHGMLSDEAGEA